METHIVETLLFARLSAQRSRDWVRQVITLLDTAVGQLHPEAQAIQGTILEATSLLRRQIEPEVTRDCADGRGRLLAWQARKVRDFIEAEITGRICIADLAALVQRSPAHFSRSFKRTFGKSPLGFVIRRRVELAAQCMLETDASLSDIAQRFAFTDQAHLCKHFRQLTGQTPGAWRRAHRSHHDEDGMTNLRRPTTRVKQSPAFSRGPLLQSGS